MKTLNPSDYLCLSLPPLPPTLTFLRALIFNNRLHCSCPFEKLKMYRRENKVIKYQGSKDPELEKKKIKPKLTDFS